MFDVLGSRNLDLRRKIILVAVVPTVLLVVAFLVVFAVQRGRVADDVEKGFGRLAEESLARAARDLRTLCDATHQELWNQVPRSLAVARDQVERLGPVTFSDQKVAWRARNQLDGTVSEVELPRVLIGGKWAGQNSDPSIPSPLVDRIRALVGAEATVFQRLNERGDMMRVVTTVPDRDGRRAIGTFIPAVDPSGQPNPVVSTVLRGDTYRGRARVIDRWYLAGYEPIRDGAGRVAGMLFIGLRQDSLEGIRSGVAASRIGETGSMYVLGGSANQRGRFLIAPAGHQDGEDAWEAKDADGAPFVQKLVNAAVGARGETVLLTYSRPAGDERHERAVAVTWFEPWDWVIVAEMDREEVAAGLRQVQSSLLAAVSTVVLVAILLLLASIGTARRWAARIAAPLEAMAVAAERIAQGDVEQSVTYRSGDEVGRLAEAFRGTIAYIQDAARAAAALARGDLGSRLELRSEQDALGKSFQAAQAEVRRVTEETNRLTRAALEGRLDERADAARFQGEFRRIVEGVNATLSSLVSHLDAVPAPAMIVSPDFEIRYMNPTGASLLGRTPAQLVGTKCYDHFRTGDCRTERCACARAMREGREASSETDAHPEGLDLHILYTAVPLRDGAGRVVGGLEIVGEQIAVRRERAAGDDERPRPAPTPAR